MSRKHHPDEWDAAHCALRMPNGDLCQTHVNKSPKVAPFCSVFHRDEYRRQQARLDEAKYVETCAGVDDLVSNAGRVCRIRFVRTEEMRNDKKRPGRRYKSGVFNTLFYTHCGDKVGGSGR